MNNPSQRAAHVAAQTTVGAREQAEHLAARAIEERLAACAQISEIDSFYRWNDTVHSDPEFLLTLKTTADAASGPLHELIAREHPYDEPEFIVLPIIGGSDSYLDWIRESVGSGPR